jgi:DNA-directed RNA polymerase specialized sigma54-like protein
MDNRAYKILKEEISKKSIGKVAKELGLSKATISLVARNKYPNPQKIYSKIKEHYKQEIIGVQSTTTDLTQLLKEIDL